MNFKSWLISEEIFPNKTATVYHRTKSFKNIENILQYGFKPGGGCLYGCGLYTTFDLKSQFSPNMQQYGNYIVKFKITNLENYLITPISVAKYILKDNYKISDQFKKVGYDRFSGESLASRERAERLAKGLPGFKHEEYDQEQKTALFSSDLAQKIFSENNWIQKSFAGVIYNGRQDGYCLVKYEPINDDIIMLGYAEAPANKYWEKPDESKYRDLISNKGWKTSTTKEKIKSLWKKPNKKKTEINIELEDNIAAALKNYAKNNQIYKFKKLLAEHPYLENKDFSDIIELAKDKTRIIKILISRKTISLNSNNVANILYFAPDKKEAAELLGSENINKLEYNNIEILIFGAKNAFEMSKIITQNKKDWTGSEIKSLFFNMQRRYVNVEIVAKTLGSENISKLYNYDIKELMHNISKDLRRNLIKVIIQYKEPLSQADLDLLLSYTSFEYRQEIVKMILQTKKDNNQELTSYDVYVSLLYATDKQEIAEILGNKNINKLDYIQTLNLLKSLNDEDKEIMIEILGDKYKLSDYQKKKLMEPYTPTIDIPYKL